MTQNCCHPPIWIGIVLIVIMVSCVIALVCLFVSHIRDLKGDARKAQSRIDALDRIKKETQFHNNTFSNNPHQKPDTQIRRPFF